MAGVSLVETAKTLKNSYDEKKNYALSTMSSHRDIVRSLKQKEKKKEGETEQIDDEDSSNSRSEELAVPKTPKLTAVSKKSDMMAADFLKQRIDEIKNNSRPKPVVVKNPVVKAKNDDFELEIFDGESKTARKLMDLTNGDDGLGSLNGAKRKRDQSDEDETAKRMRTAEQNDD